MAKDMKDTGKQAIIVLFILSNISLSNRWILPSFNPLLNKILNLIKYNFFFKLYIVLAIPNTPFEIVLYGNIKI